MYGVQSVCIKYTKRCRTTFSYDLVCPVTERSTWIFFENQNVIGESYKNGLAYYDFPRLQAYPGDMIFQKDGGPSRCDVKVLRYLDRKLLTTGWGKLVLFHGVLAHEVQRKATSFYELSENGFVLWPPGHNRERKKKLRCMFETWENMIWRTSTKPWKIVYALHGKNMVNISNI